MPTYEYQCSTCGHAWEQEQRIVEAPIELCPACNEKSAKRLISGGNFILKGGGWYADLYSSTGKSGSSSSSSSSSGKSETKASSDSSKSASTSTPTASVSPA